MEIDVGNLADSFIVTLHENMKEQYNCFRTEVRDTGVFICGLHKGEKWLSEKSACPEISTFSYQALNTLYDAIDRLNPSVFTKTNSNLNKASSSYFDDEFDLFADYEDFF